MEEDNGPNSPNSEVGGNVGKYESEVKLLGLGMALKEGDGDDPERSTKSPGLMVRLLFAEGRVGYRLSLPSAPRN